MKNKILFSLVGVLSLFGVSTVKADTLDFSYNGLSSSSVYDINFIEEKSQELISYWRENRSEDYPYYYISFYNGFSYSETGSVVGDFSIDLHFFDSAPLNLDTLRSFINKRHFIYYYSFSNGNSSSTISFGDAINNSPSHFLFDNSTFDYFGYDYYDSNFDLRLGGSDIFNINNGSDNLYSLSSEDIIPTLKSFYIDELNYTEINLNNYSYVALSLKDYTEREEFYTNVEVQGQYCLTPVYDYGLKEKKDVISGFKNQACSPYYDNYTPVRTYILESDIKNHAIYYLKAYDTTKENKVKVDTSVFNIHYITFEEADNPILNINGRNYTTIPYDNLTDSATISEEEGYVSGSSCGVGDFNCTSQYYGGFKFSDIFTSPIEFFKNLWTSIAKVFELVVMLVSLLPPAVQYFFYISFMLAIVIGIIKIIL